MDCQLEDLPGAGDELTPADRLGHRLAKGARYLARNGRRVVSDPGLILRKLRRRPEPDPPAVDVPRRLDLQPGEWVRVRPREVIRATLDERGRCEGLAYMPEMDRYCGRTFRVRKRIRRFFDERTRRMLKLRRVVILEDAMCEPNRDADIDYAGCDRTCFLFWKEAWLERLT